MVLLNEKQKLVLDKLGNISIKKNNCEYGSPLWDKRDLIDKNYYFYIKQYAKIILSKNNYHNKNDKNMLIVDTFKTLLYINNNNKFNTLYGSLYKEPFVTLAFPNINEYNFKLCIRDLNILKKSMGLYHIKNGKKVLLNRKTLDMVVDSLWYELIDIKNKKEKYNFIPQKKDVLNELNEKIDKVDSLNYTFSKYFNSKIKYTCCNSILEIRSDFWF
tara:strand:- start:138 stop:785 length:648 start_codon:yes stop_codon:yes gene_type:complete